MKLFDSHCHLDDKSYNKDIEDVLNRAENSGVTAVMIVGTTVKRSEKAIRIAEAGDGRYASVGIHPHDASECTEQALEQLKRLAHSPKVKAWGETGLDFNRMFSPQKDQEHWFIRQIETAGDLGLPIIFHERDSSGRFAALLITHHKDRGNGVVHCFSGNKSELYQYLDLGYSIGITGILTIKKRGADLRELAPLIPEDRILIETDAPYLTPSPEKNRVRRNEPAFVKSTLLKLAEVRGVYPEDLSSAIWKNTCRLYNISTGFSGLRTED